jgi:23S rRNA (adenine2030-N6)-methyltransferase
MLSYQHIYHAGNLADVHKHAALAWILSYLVQKDKPLSYFETHAGRGLYDLGAPEALKTQEAENGYARLNNLGIIPSDHIYAKTLDACTQLHGSHSYPGSPWVAHHILRPTDRMTLCELHPQEANHLRAVFPKAKIAQNDGFATVLSACPPTPRRGLVLIDPSYEIKTDYDTIPKFISNLNKKWNVGIIALWYPILTDARHRTMVRSIRANHENLVVHEVSFPPAKQGHGMVGSGLAIVNAPFNTGSALSEISGWFAHLT